MDMLQATMGTGLSYQQTSTTLRQLHMLKFCRLYSSSLSYELAHRGTTSIALPASRGFHRNWPPEKFSAFQDPHGYSGSVPSPSYLLSITLAFHRFRRKPLVARMMMITGQILKGDMSFKLAKKIRADRTGQYTCVFSLMNEYGEILGYWFCRTKSILHLKSELEKVKKRYERQTGKSSLILRCILPHKQLTVSHHTILMIYILLAG
eukprot:scaffold132287_cov33-Prasinocladus_malaysianus.AAC.3